MNRFTYVAHPARVLFGEGTLAQVPDEVERLGVRRALVLCTPQQRDQAQRVADLLGDRCAGIHDQAQMHVPIETARQARSVAEALQADGAVAVGGGTAIGLGKAIALESGLPILAIPTTYAGSEMTPIYGITEGGVKKTGKSASVLPRTVIYDPALSADLPFALSATSGMNAMAHAVEGLYAQDSNPIMSLLAQEGIAALAGALPRLRDAARDPAARADALYGAWLCGTVLGNVGMALHHKLCHTLGGSFDLPHAETHTVVLPHALVFNSRFIPQAMPRLAAALGSDRPALALHRLAQVLGAPVSLRALGLREQDLDRAAALAVANPYWNPRPVELAAVRGLLQRAWEGAEPDETV